MVVGAFLLVLTGLTAKSSAGVNLNIGIDIPLPALAIPVPPSVVVIPGSYVYYAPDTNADLLFYHGYWYRPYEGGWYRAHSYNGRWTRLASSRVPRALIDLPPGYRGMSRGRGKIAYGQLTSNWGRWEKERYWDNHREEQEDRAMGHMAHMGRGRSD
ncbi:MAG: hypothetical protein ACHQ0Y_04680 [Thermodesulfovibrionales bacterium]